MLKQEETLIQSVGDLAGSGYSTGMITTCSFGLMAAMAAVAAPAEAAPPNVTQPPVQEQAAKSQSTSPDPEAFKAALALFEDHDVAGQLAATAVRGAQSTLDVQLESQRKRGIEIPESLVQRLRTVVLTEVKAMADTMALTFRADAAAVYARHFSAAELRELKRLQANPVVRKSEEIMPQLFVELGEIGMRLAAERQPELEKKLRVMIEEWLVEQKLEAQVPKT